jgi:selenocysteine lyase/cysteine desulfurase
MIGGERQAVRKWADSLLYWDQAATRRPRCSQLAHDFQEYLEGYTANPGRGFYASARRAMMLVEEARSHLAEFVAAPERARVVFTDGVTGGLNLAIQGLMGRGGHAVATAYEHNSVLRPLKHMARRGLIELDIWWPGPDGEFRVEDLKALLRDETRLVCMTHASNVTGTLLPIEQVGRLLARTRACLLVDSAQTAGLLPLNMAGSYIDMLVFSGHKGLGSVPGVGCLALSEKAAVEPVRFGGTGGDDALETVPADALRALEPGTPNVMGILLLLRAAQRCTPEVLLRRRTKARKLRSALLGAFQGLPGVEALGATGDGLPILSLKTLYQRPGEVADLLDGNFNIETRAGHHCAPLIHDVFGTRTYGTLRLSPPLEATDEEVQFVRSAVIEVTGSG